VKNTYSKALASNCTNPINSKLGKMFLQVIQSPFMKWWSNPNASSKNSEALNDAFATMVTVPRLLGSPV